MQYYVKPGWKLAHTMAPTANLPSIWAGVAKSEGIPPPNKNRARTWLWTGATEQTLDTVIELAKKMGVELIFLEGVTSNIGDYQVNINAASGLPGWVNHIAFDAPSREALDRHRARWQQHGHRVIEIDHGFCSSIYLSDPSGNMVEFCLTTRSFTDAERTDALAKLQAPKPEFDADPTIIVHDALSRA